ncbi:MAG: hypothetical protein DI582_03965 [Azospirillum brasilense]|nr:MAG: hypothetical protein DI582_03965 [Azospirillum brasilense]
MTNNVIRVLPRNAFALDLRLDSLNVSDMRVFPALSAITKLEAAGKHLIGHVVGPKKSALIGIVTEDEYTALRSLIHEQCHVAPDAIAPSWRAPANGQGLALY